MKEIEYFLSLNYPIEILGIREEEGGGYQACIPMLGRDACVGDGDTIDEAIKDLEEVKRYILEAWQKEGRKIPEPETDVSTTYSGKLLLRMSPHLHQSVKQNAERDGISINQYIQKALATDSPIGDLNSIVDQLKAQINLLRKQVDQIQVCLAYYAQPSSQEVTTEVRRGHALWFNEIDRSFQNWGLSLPTVGENIILSDKVTELADQPLLTGSMQKHDIIGE